MVNVELRILELANDVEVPDLEVRVLQRDYDWQVRSELLVELAELGTDLRSVYSFLERLLLQFQKLLRRVYDFFGQRVAIQLCDLPLHPVRDADEVLRRKAPKLVVRRELILDLANTAEISDKLAEEPLAPVADHCGVESGLYALLEGLTLPERLVILDPQVVVLLDDLELQGYLSNLVAQFVLHHLEVFLECHGELLQPFEAVALVFEDVQLLRE